jgi:threonyl-tRNA synthetase
MSDSNLEHIRHSLAHLLAAAVLNLWPETKITLGPTVENGFYYDFDLPCPSEASGEGGPEPINDSSLPKIEKKMRELLKKWDKFEQSNISEKDARKIFEGNQYKQEIIDDYKNEQLTVVKSGEFTDLCRGGHVESAKDIDSEAFKLTHIAGAYWRGDEKNKMLTRIYGVAFETKEELDKYLWMLEEAKKRDHRKLGKQLDLFTFSDLVGSGFPLYTPKGALVRRLLNDYIEELQSAAGYTQVWTPQVAKAELFKTSGHYDKYKDDMFRVVSNYSEEEFYLKPMNCPQHTQIYASQMRSYRDLPIRYTDFAMLYRDEKPGELSGLARVRSFSQDDCHVFCREDQVDAEIDTALEMTKKVMATFGFKYRYRLSTRDPQHPEKYIGDPKIWDKLEKWAEKIMKRNDIEYFDGPGEAAFYGPKMDLMATDALGREWQLSTVQIDFVQPERFDLSYIDDKGGKVRPVMIHRAIIGSPERFMMVLLEHFAGALPFWLSPVQVKVLPISDKLNDYANEVMTKIKDAGIRIEIDDRSESIGKKIRENEMQKIPVLLIVGEKEKEAGTISVRRRNIGDIGVVEVKEIISILKEEIAEKK